MKIVNYSNNLKYKYVVEYNDESETKIIKIYGRQSNNNDFKEIYQYKNNSFSQTIKQFITINNSKGIPKDWFVGGSDCMLQLFLDLETGIVYDDTPNIKYTLEYYHLKSSIWNKIIDVSNCGNYIIVDERILYNEYLYENRYCLYKINLRTTGEERNRSLEITNTKIGWYKMFNINLNNIKELDKYDKSFIKVRFSKKYVNRIVSNVDSIIFYVINDKNIEKNICMLKFI